MQHAAQRRTGGFGLSTRPEGRLPLPRPALSCQAGVPQAGTGQAAGSSALPSPCPCNVACVQEPGPGNLPPSCSSSRDCWALDGGMPGWETRGQLRHVLHGQQHRALGKLPATFCSLQELWVGVWAKASVLSTIALTRAWHRHTAKRTVVFHHAPWVLEMDSTVPIVLMGTLRHAANRPDGDTCPP